ncbi:LOW QUALITY PROTEIN: hypothetical protein YC2023_081867 [Brassica napus]
MSSEKDSYDKPSRKVTRILGQTDPGRRNNETSIRLDQPGSPSKLGARPTRPSGELDRTSSPTGPLGKLDRTNIPTRRTGELDRTSSPTLRTDELDRTSSPTRRTGELDRASSPNRPLGELDQLTYLCLVLVAPFFEIGSNLLLFHLDRSPQKLVISYEIRIDRIKGQRLTKHLELPPLYEKFKLSLESTSFRKRSFDKSLKRLSQKTVRKSAAKSPLTILYEIEPNRYDSLSFILQEKINVKFGG